MMKEHLLKKGGILHTGIQNMYVNHLPGLIVDNKLSHKKLDLYRMKFSDFFQKLWNESEIYKSDGVYFCLSSKDLFWVQDLSLEHIA